MFNFGKRSLVLIALSLAGSAALVRTTPVAHAQSVFRLDILSNWKSDLGGAYILRSNGTYIFSTTFPGAKAISYSGTWSLRNRN